jgi:hypothetical protein
MRVRCASQDHAADQVETIALIAGGGSQDPRVQERPGTQVATAGFRPILRTVDTQHKLLLFPTQLEAYSFFHLSIPCFGKTFYVRRPTFCREPHEAAPS